MNPLSENFKAAAWDYRYLLERKYSQKTMLEMVGNRYALSGLQRTMLYRGITTGEQALKRKNRLITSNKAGKLKLHIDGFNVLITIANYLFGKALFVATDGFLRDAAEIDGKQFKPEIAERSLQLMISYLEYAKINSFSLYFDESLNREHHIEQLAKEIIKHAGKTGEVLIAITVDEILITIESGMAATSDSLIIDNSKIPVLDLAREVIEFHFNPHFAYLESEVF